MYTFGPADIAALKETFSPSFVGSVLQVIPSFFGGLFAGYWTYFFELKRVRQEKRRDKYYEHRNTIVQIEQELIPFRLKIARNIKSIDDALENSEENHARFILKFDKLFLSTGLGLRLLNIDLINLYARLYSDVDSFNADLDYVANIVSSLIENKKLGRSLDRSIVSTYMLMLPYLKEKAQKIDENSLLLLTTCQIVILKEKEKEILKEFIRTGDQIQYNINDKRILEQRKKVESEEDFSQHPNEIPPKFLSLFLDVYW